MLIALLLFIAWQIAPLRGRLFHNLLVARVAQASRRAGFTAVLECPLRLSDGRTDFLDLLLTRGAQVIACEVETTPRYVIVNVEKALALALPVWVVVPTRPLRTAVARRLQARLGWPDTRRIWILLPDEVPQALTTLPAIDPCGEWWLGKEKTNAGRPS